MASLGGLDDDFNFFLPDTLLESDSNSDDERSAETFGEHAGLPTGFVTTTGTADMGVVHTDSAPIGQSRILGLTGHSSALGSRYEQPYMDPQRFPSEQILADSPIGDAPYEQPPVFDGGGSEQLPPWMAEPGRPGLSTPGFHPSAAMPSTQSFQPARRGGQQQQQQRVPLTQANRPQHAATLAPNLPQQQRLSSSTRASAHGRQNEQIGPGKWHQNSAAWPPQHAGSRPGHAGTKPAGQGAKQTRKDDRRGGAPHGDADHGFAGSKNVPTQAASAKDKKQKLRESKLAAEARQEKRNLEAARIKEDQRKQEELQRQAKARIAAAREEVNEPVFMASKNLERERERERERAREREREREILEAQRQAELRSRMSKKEKARARSRIDDDTFIRELERMGDASEDSGKARKRDGGNRKRDGSDSIDDADADAVHDRKEKGRKEPSSSKKNDRNRRDADSKRGAAKERPPRNPRTAAPVRPADRADKAPIKLQSSRSLTSAVLPPATAVITNAMQYMMQLSWWISGLAVHCASWLFRFIMSLQKSALNGLTADHHVAFCFSFLYSFPFLVAMFTPWAPPWAPVCLWYAFLVQLFCIQGRAHMVMISRRVLPLMFLLEGVSHHSFLLDLNGSERLVVACLLSALKTQSIYETICLVSLIAQVFLTFLMGWNMPVVQWVILVIGLSTITPDFDQIQNFDANLDSASHYMNSGGPVGTSGGLYTGGLDSGTLSNGNGINHSLGADGFPLGIGGTGHGTGHGADNQPGYSTQSVGSASGAHGRMYSAGVRPGGARRVERRRSVRR